MVKNSCGPKIIILYVLAICSIWTVCTFILTRRIPEVNQAVVDRLVPIYKDNSVTQTIAPTHNGLNVVVIFLKNRSIQNNDKFLFTLTNQENESMRSIQISGSNIGDGDTVRFQFEPLVDSANKKFVISLSTPDTSPPKTPIEVGFSNGDTYPLGIASDMGDMSFQLFYSPVDKRGLMFELWSMFTAKINGRLVWIVGVSIFVCSRLLKLIK